MDTIGQPDEIVNAARKAVELLIVDPGSVGESRADDERALIIGPLGFLYTVNELSHTATILDVWLSG